MSAGGEFKWARETDFLDSRLRGNDGEDSRPALAVTVQVFRAQVFIALCRFPLSPAKAGIQKLKNSKLLY